MTRQRPRTMSQLLAAAVTFAAVLIMLTPLRRGPSENQSRQAGWTPLMNLGGMAETNAFRRLNTSPTRFAASARPLSRQVSPQPLP